MAFHDIQKTFYGISVILTSQTTEKEKEGPGR